jgi:hypothetical protein
MGPRHVGRGNAGCAAPFSGFPPRFNGAATRRSRKRPARSLSCSRAECFNGAATRRSRKRITKLPARLWMLSFNGAATRRSRKPLAEPQSSAGWRRFNGAATRRSRKQEVRRPPEGIRAASMGPRHVGRGNAPMSRSQRGRGRCFNGAATRRSRKRPQGRRPACGLRCFNGAATRRSRKRILIAASFHLYSASMGPRHVGRGNHRSHCRRHDRGLASMGPRHVGRGNMTCPGRS